MAEHTEGSPVQPLASPTTVDEIDYAFPATIDEIDFAFPATVDEIDFAFPATVDEIDCAFPAPADGVLPGEMNWLPDDSIPCPTFDISDLDAFQPWFLSYGVDGSPSHIDTSLDFLETGQNCINPSVLDPCLDSDQNCINPSVLDSCLDFDQVAVGECEDKSPPTEAEIASEQPVRSEVLYIEWLESLPAPIPDKAVPFYYIDPYRPARKRTRRAGVRGCGCDLQAQRGSGREAARSSGSRSRRPVLAPSTLDHGQYLRETDQGDDEPLQQTINQHGESSASESPRQSSSDTELISVPARHSKIVFRSPYTDEQLCASDSYARSKFRAHAANMKILSTAYISAIRRVFPFYATGITLKDRKGGYYTFDADGLPVLHDRVLKADEEANSEAGKPTRRKRKSVHQFQRPTPRCDPRRWYDTWKYRPAPWHPDNKFVYLEDAQLAYREYSAEDIKLYLKHCPRNYILWVQSEPSQSAHRRLHRDGKPCEEDSKCRWSGCPINGRSFSGLYRVAFDEFPAQTSQGIKDPYKVAMVMHLWCFEQILDPVLYYNKRILLPDTRTFVTPSPENSSAASGALEPDRENEGRAEIKNNFCSKLGDTQRQRTDWGPLKNAFYPWFKETKATKTLPRLYEQSLCYNLTTSYVGSLPKCKLDQFDKRRQVRGEKMPMNERNKEKEEEEARTRMKEERKNSLVDGSGAHAKALPSEADAFKGTTYHVHLGSLAGLQKALDEREEEKQMVRKRRRRTFFTENNGAQPQEAETSGNVQDGGEFGSWLDNVASPDQAERDPKRRRTTQTN
ncbi:hypothetical protein E4U55_001780 [Claviceps digitariae]|nr:hypothetical protein E4U55_001780 [Claviceps digitariae]